MIVLFSSEEISLLEFSSLEPSKELSKSLLIYLFMFYFLKICLHSPKNTCGQLFLPFLKTESIDVTNVTQIQWKSSLDISLS